MPKDAALQNLGDTEYLFEYLAFNNVQNLNQGKEKTFAESFLGIANFCSI